MSGPRSGLEQVVAGQRGTVNNEYHAMLSIKRWFSGLLGVFLKNRDRFADENLMDFSSTWRLLAAWTLLWLSDEVSMSKGLLLVKQHPICENLFSF